MKELTVILGAITVTAVFLIVYFFAKEQALTMAKYVGDKMLISTALGGGIAIIIRIIDRYFDSKK